MSSRTGNLWSDIQLADPKYIVQEQVDNALPFNSSDRMCEDRCSQHTAASLCLADVILCMQLLPHLHFKLSCFQLSSQPCNCTPVLLNSDLEIYMGRLCIVLSEAL